MKGSLGQHTLPLAAICSALLLTLLSVGCTTTDAFEPVPGAINIVLHEDDIVRIDGDVVHHYSIVEKLKAMGVSDKARLVIHAHTGASSEVFRKLDQVLKDNGYSYRQYDTFDALPE